MISNKRLIERSNSAKSDRGQWETHWQEVNENVLPRKDDIITRRTPGEKRGQLLFESTAIQSNELLANHLHGVLSNPAVTFFELFTGDDKVDNDDDNRFWLQDSVQKLHNILSRSNFHTEVHEFYLDLCSLGTAVMQIEEDDDLIVRFSTRGVKEVCVEENSKGQVDHIYRRFCWPAHKICEHFGDENIPDNVLKAKEKGSLEEFEILHAILPRDYKERNKKKGNKSYEFESRYVLIDGEHTLLEEGFQELPIVVSRWTKTSGEVYGRSPAMNALPDIKMANKMMETTIMGAQLTVAPPFLLPDDGVRLPLKLRPFAVNFYRSGLTESRVDPLFQTPPRVDFGFQVIEAVIKKIREAFYVEQLLTTKNAEMTATEVMQRNEENIRLLGPMYGRQQFETLRPLVDRVFGIALRRGVLLPPPPALQGRVLDVRYSSLIAKAQRSSEVQNVIRVMQTIAPIAQVNPAVMDNFRFDNIARFVAQQLSLPQHLLSDQREMAQAREQRAQQEQKLVDQADAEHQAEVVNKVAPHMIKAKEAS